MNSPNLRGLAYLAVRALAIFAFILGLQRLVLIFETTIPFYMNMPPELVPENLNIASLALLTGIPAFVLIVFSILLWVLAGKLAGKMAPRGMEGKGESEKTLQIKALESILLSAAGLVLVILAIGRIALLLAQYFHMESTLPDFVYFDRREYLYGLIEHGIRLILGLLLIFKAEGLAYLLGKIRSIGFQRTEAAERFSE